MQLPTQHDHIVTMHDEEERVSDVSAAGGFGGRLWQAFGFDFRLIVTIGSTIFILVVITTVGRDTDTTFFSLPVNCSAGFEVAKLFTQWKSMLYFLYAWCGRVFLCGWWCSRVLYFLCVWCARVWGRHLAGSRDSCWRRC